MSWKQVKPFNPSAGGTKKGYCLQNVRLGYGVGPKYNTATEAWNHTEQHADRNIPSGVDVPLYYKYVDSNGNEGHVNVRLADGRVWSDGTIYANLDDYTSKHSAVTYLGWGESVNGTRVIEYASDPAPQPQSQHTVFLPSSVDRWRLYDVNTFPKVGNEKAFLRPSQFPPGLTYDIIQYRDGGNTVEIQTQMFGRGKIWIKDTEAQIK